MKRFLLAVVVLVVIPAILAVVFVSVFPVPAPAQFNEARQGALQSRMQGDTANYSPAITVPGASAVGSPTFVQTRKEGGGFIQIGQAFGDFLQPYVDSIVNALILAAMGWAFTWVKKNTGLAIDQKQRDALTAFLQNQASSLIAEGMVKVEGTKVHVDNAALVHAANAIFARVPDAAKHFGITPQNVGDAVSKRIVAAIPQVTAGASLIAQGAADKTASTLP